MASGASCHARREELTKMGHAGITCLDCHNPHSGKLKLPFENSALFLDQLHSSAHGADCFGFQLSQSASSKQSSGITAKRVEVSEMA